MKHLLVTIVISTLFIAMPQSSAHSGGTDKYGCHAGSRPYHCHTPKAQKPSYQSLKPWTSSVQPLEGLITESFLDIAAQVKHLLVTVKRTPSVVKSCDEWIMISKLMVIAGWSGTGGITNTGTECVQQKGLNNISQEMVRLIHQLPLE